MGCLHTKAGRVQPVEGAEVSIDNTESDIEMTDHGTQTKLGENKTASKRHKNLRKNKRDKRQTSKRKDSLDSTESLEDNISNAGSDRGFSATSSTSKQSADSGLGDDHYAAIITEDSSKDVVDMVEKEFGQEKELGIVCMLILLSQRNNVHCTISCISLMIIITTHTHTMPAYIHVRAH